MIGRGRFKTIVKTQLDLFEQDHSDLLDSAAEVLADMRDRYARPLEESLDDEYTAAFDRAASRRYPRLAPHLG